MIDATRDRMVRFVRNRLPYNEGEVAAFDAKHAEQLVIGGFAHYCADDGGPIDPEPARAPEAPAAAPEGETKPAIPDHLNFSIVGPHPAAS